MANQEIAIPNLKPNTKIDFVISSEILTSDVLSQKFRLRVPKFAKRIDKTTATYTAKRLVSSIGTTEEFIIRSYKCEIISRSNKTQNRLILYLVSQNTGVGIGVGNRIKITAPSGPLSSINNKQYEVVRVNQTGNEITMAVLKTDLSPGSSRFSTNQNKISLPNTYTVRVTQYDVGFTGNDARYHQQLMNNDYVKDMFVWAFQQSSDTITAATPKRSLVDLNWLSRLPTGTVIDETTSPPQYESIRNINRTAQPNGTFTYPVQGPSDTITLNNQWGQYVRIFVSIARYTLQSDGTWTGQWLHKKDGKIIWKEVVPRTQ